MKKIAITGSNGYVATSLKEYFTEYEDEFKITMINVRNNDWKKLDFSEFYAIIHSAAIVHASGKSSSWEDFQRVNIDLTYNLALKAKENGVKMFVFLSSISVHGLSGDMGNIESQKCKITETTPSNPASMYGKSKLLAEEAIKALSSEDFNTLILRCPMIYGRNCPGNYSTLRKIALKFKVVPDYINQRSMLHISNLCSFIKISLEREIFGVFYPQDHEYVCTAEMMWLIAKNNDTKAYKSKLLTLAVIAGLKLIKPLRKAFGNLCIDFALSAFELGYHTGSLQECMKKSESFAK